MDYIKILSFHSSEDTIKRVHDNPQSRRYPFYEYLTKDIQNTLRISVRQKTKYHKQKSKGKLEQNNYNTYHKKGLVSLVCKELLQTNKKMNDDGIEK